MEQPSEPFVIVLRRRGTAGVVEAGGVFDLCAVAMFKVIVDAAMHEDVEAIELDLAGVSFLDSAGINSILQTRKVAHDRGIEFRVTVASPAVARMLEMTGLTQLLL